tara:strand:- start:7712 stop:8011 length:300 start_codon:yes stop_codon:yes gene_type:complete
MKNSIIAISLLILFLVGCYGATNKSSIKTVNSYEDIKNEAISNFSNSNENIFDDNLIFFENINGDFERMYTIDTSIVNSEGEIERDIIVRIGPDIVVTP